MHFLVYSRAVPEREFPEYTAEDEGALNERHWSYIDRFSEGMIARGPTLGPTRETWTGSLHIVDLPDSETARAFVANEPYQRAGLFAGHSVWRFSDRLGRTMWQYAAATDEPRYLVLAHRGSDPEPVPVGDLDPRWREALVVYGALSTLDGAPDGMVAAVQVPSRDMLDTLMAEPTIGLSHYSQVEVHDWEFGGRR
jgi:uncharacterized protein YciI